MADGAAPVAVVLGVTSGVDRRVRSDRRFAEDDVAFDTGFELVEIRDAPDRPGLELVFISQRVTCQLLTRCA